MMASDGSARDSRKTEVHLNDKQSNPSGYKRHGSDRMHFLDFTIHASHYYNGACTSPAGSSRPSLTLFTI
jgi:hypothetical protein